MGFETAKHLAGLGMHVIIGRNQSEGPVVCKGFGTPQKQTALQIPVCFLLFKRLMHYKVLKAITQENFKNHSCMDLCVPSAHIQRKRQLSSWINKIHSLYKGAPKRLIELNTLNINTLLLFLRHIFFSKTLKWFLCNCTLVLKHTSLVVPYHLLDECSFL